MRKFLSMMLLVCTVLTFAACSSDDDAPSNPVTGAVVPSTAQIGAETTVNGTGFNASGLSLYLVDASGNETNTNASFTANGATFTVPYTATTGSYSLVLKQGNSSWTLGNVTLTEAANPITSLSMPEEMGYNAAGTATATIGGIGFADGDQIVFMPAASIQDLAPSQNAVRGTVTADGLQIAVPNTLAEDEYLIALVRGNSTWLLQDSPVYVYQQKQIKSIVIESPYAEFYGLENLTINFTYNADGTIAAVSSNTSTSFSGFNYKFAYSGNTITATDDAGTVLTYTLQNGLIVSSTDPSADTSDSKYPDEPNSTWKYDSDNHVISVDNAGEYYMGAAFTAEYDELGRATTFSIGSETGLKYDSRIRAVPGTIDPSVFVDFFSAILIKPDAVIGMMLNQGAATSKYVPTTATLQDIDWSSYEYVSVDMVLNSSLADNVLIINTYGSQTSAGFYGSKATVTYEAK